MNEITKRENEWQDKATAAAIAAARKIALNSSGLPPMTPVGRLSDSQWGWIVTAVIFGWIQTRCEQAIAEGLNQEQAVRLTGLTPSPCDVAVVCSILPALADQAAIDWSQPLAAWSKDTMTNFLMLAWALIGKSKLARDQGPGKIIRPIPSDLSIPDFLRRTSDQASERSGQELNDPVPFVP
ncbi:MAG: hypothetical protein WAV38_12740 [Xanthobacteraceae bacterium]